MLIPYYAPVVGILAAVFLREKKVRSVPVYGSGFLFAILMEAIRGYTSFLPEMMLVIAHTMNYVLGYRITRSVLKIKNDKNETVDRKKMFLSVLLLGILLTAVSPLGPDKIAYKVKGESYSYTIQYKYAGRIWRYLRRNLGCSRAASAGILGNMFAESEYRPDVVQTNGIGHGIGQWSWDRWYGEDGLQAYADNHGKNWEDLGLQLSFFRHEVVENDSMGVYYQGGFSKYRHLREVDGEDGTAHIFFFSFEYGGYMSYDDFISDTFEANFATRSKRLMISKRIYEDKRRFP